MEMIKLEQFDETDFDRLISWIDSEEFMLQFAGPIFTFPLTTDQLDLYISDKNRFALKVISLETGKVIGHSEVYNSGNKIVKLCRILLGDKNLRGRGIGEEIVKGLVEFSFNKLDALTIELNVYEWNTSAIRCYEKVGFIVNPLISNTTKFKNHEWTSLNMVLNKLNN